MTTPDFMLLPLEFQGYCPWTLVEARGLLLPGKPGKKGISAFAVLLLGSSTWLLLITVVVEGERR